MSVLVGKTEGAGRQQIRAGDMLEKDYIKSLKGIRENFGITREELAYRAVMKVEELEILEEGLEPAPKWRRIEIAQALIQLRAQKLLGTPEEQAREERRRKAGLS